MGRIKPIEPGSCFWRWTVLEMTSEKAGDGCVKYACRCQCGAVRNIKSSKLRAGESKSCGCYSRDMTSQRNKVHGLSRGPDKKKTSEYTSWDSMKARCNNPKHRAYKYYGGRGIVICKRWKDYENFYKDMGSKPTPKHQIDRIDNDGNYDPSNCRWVTRLENMQNRSTSRTWFILGLSFPNTRSAAKYFKVSQSTIRVWCLGLYAKGHQVNPPALMCFADEPICDL